MLDVLQQRVVDRLGDLAQVEQASLLLLLLKMKMVITGPRADDKGRGREEEPPHRLIALQRLAEQL